MKNISETAYLVAMYRALETESANSLFQDPYARKLAGGLGEMLAEVVGSQKQAKDVIAIRTYLIDELIEQIISTEGIDTVVNLAAGLDTRPYRLSLPSSLRWIEIDLPEIIDYKAQILLSAKPNCILERCQLDLIDIQLRNNLFSEINTAGKQILVVTEGLLSYLSSEQVASLTSNLCEQSNFRWWLFELLSSSTSQPQKSYNRKIFDQYFGSGDSTLQFSPAEGAQFFHQYGWEVAECKSAWEESYRLKRGGKLASVGKFLLKSFAKKTWEDMNQQANVVLLRKS